MSDAMEFVMDKHANINLISVTALKKIERSQVSQTVYRKGSDLLINTRSEENSKLTIEESNNWTRVFKSCLTDSWNFGYYYYMENDTMR